MAEAPAAGAAAGDVKIEGAAAAGADVGKGAEGAAGAGTILDKAGDGAAAAAAAAGAANGKDGVIEPLSADWRERMAGGNEKHLAQLKRFTTPAAVAEHLLTERQRISKGNVLPEKATSEQIAEYRKENGIPEKPEGYLEKLPESLKFTDAEKPLVDKFTAALHGLNAKPEVVHGALAAYNEVRAEAEQKRIQLNETRKAEGIAALRQEWGTDNERNLNVIGNVLAAMPEDARTALSSARTADGVMLFNNPAVLKALAQMGLDINPAYSVLPGSSDPVKGMATEIEQIEAIMKGADSQKYWGDPKMQARYRELLGARASMPRT